MQLQLACWPQLLFRGRSHNRRRYRRTTPSVASEVLESRTLLTVFVDCHAPASGNNDGTSWEDAYLDLQNGLQKAKSTGEDIHVANGVYHPGSSRFDTFQLFPGVKLYGGYAGYNPSPGTPDRDWTVHQTILSGDLNEDDERIYYDGNTDTYGVDGLLMDILNNADNSLTVVTGSSEALIEGFYIESGHAANSGPLPGTTGTQPQMSQGAGLYNDHASPTVRDVVFRWNEAERGGGMANNASHPNLSRVVFDSNLATSQGAGIYNFSSLPQVVNAVFYKNHVTGTARAWGGAILNADGSEATIWNSTFYGNWAQAGGAIANMNSDPNLVNSILHGNGAITQGGTGELYNDSASSPFVAFSDIAGGYAGSGNINADPRWWAPDGGAGPDQRWATGDDGLQLNDTPDNFSPAIDNGTLLQALPSLSIVVSPPVDLAGNPRPTIWLPAVGNVDMGAYERQLKTVEDTNREHSSFQSEREPVNPTEPGDPASSGATESGQDETGSAADSDQIDGARSLQDRDTTGQTSIKHADIPPKTVAAGPSHSDPPRKSPAYRSRAEVRETQPADRETQPADLDRAWPGRIQRDLIFKLNVKSPDRPDSQARQ